MPEPRVLADELPIVPIPVAARRLEGMFKLGTDVVVRHDGETAPEARRLAEFLDARLGSAPKVRKGTGSSSRAITLAVDPSVGSVSGAYTLLATADGVRIAGKDRAGVFHGIVTLLQLCPPVGDIRWSDPDGAPMPAAKVEDAPAFAWRGLQYDAGRWYLPAKDIRTLLDWMAFHKLNVFHWHLTEDQGWRFESRKYPKLTEVGAWRASSPRYGDRNASDGKRHGGYYTQRECRDIVRYAAERHITVVPEVEIPGHSSAAIASYPQFGNTDVPGFAPKVVEKWGVQSYTYAPKPETVRFLDDILGEICEVFPSKYIHIGGDEAPKSQWKASAFAQDFMKRNGLKNEEELQSWFIRQAEAMLAKRGRRLIGWDEIREGGLSPNATVMAWRSEQWGIDTVKEGKDIVMAPTSHMYLDYYQDDPKRELSKGAEYECIGGYLPIEKVYSYHPIPDALTPAEARKVLGVEAEVWGEYVKSIEKATYLAFPRAAAVAEIGWSPRARRDFAGFTLRLRALEAHYRAGGLKYGRIPS